MSYELPDEGFNPKEWAKNKTLRVSQTHEDLVLKFISGFEDFWGVENGTSRHTKEEMQLILDNMPAAAKILANAGGFKQYLTTAHPDALPEKYTKTVFVITEFNLATGKVVIGDLDPLWTPPAEESENSQAE